MEKNLDYKPKQSGIVYLLALVFPLLVQLLFSIILSTNKDLGENIVFLSIYRIVLAGSLIAIFFVFNKAKNISNFACGIKNKTNPWNILIALVGIAAFVFLTSPFVSWVDYWISLTGIKVDGSLGFSLDSAGNIVLAIFVFCLVPAITEELIFRGMILNSLRPLGKWKAVLLSAAAFCLMHANIPQFPYTFLLGILLGLVMFETRSLWLTMLMHFANNLIVIVSMAVFGEQTTDIQTEAFSTPIWLAILMFLGALLVGFLVWFLVKKLHSKHLKTQKQNQEQTSKGENNQNSLKEQATNNQKPKMDAFGWLWLCFGFAFAIVLTVVGLL